LEKLNRTEESMEAYQKVIELEGKFQ